MKKESALQIQIVNLLSYYAHKNKFVYFSVPNESALLSANKNRKSPKFFAILMHLKKMGLMPGASDLIIVKSGIAHCLEIKTQKGVQSENQKIFASNIVAAGAKYNLCYSFEEANKILKEWSII